MAYETYRYLLNFRGGGILDYSSTYIDLYADFAGYNIDQAVQAFAQALLDTQEMPLASVQVIRQTTTHEDDVSVASLTPSE